MSILELDHSRHDDWNDFVRQCSSGTFFHLAEWQNILQRVFRCRTFYMFSENSGAIDGILPLALVKRPVFGPVLVSTPLCVYGGGLGNDQALIDAAIKKAESLGVEYLELRGGETNTQNLPVSDRFYTFRRAISSDSEENLKAIPRKQRAEIRKGIKAGLQTETADNADTFYKIYAASVHNLGTPVFPKKYLRALIETFGDNCKITTITHKGTLLSGVLSFKYKDQILPYYGGGLPAARNYSAYPYLYWKVMEKAAEEDIKLFDFGRSMKDSGAFAFKKNFGFEPAPLSYRYHLVKAEILPDMNPDSPRNKVLTNTWKKLPLPIANTIGPVLYPVVM